MFLTEKGYRAVAQTTDFVQQDEDFRTRMPHKTWRRGRASDGSGSARCLSPRNTDGPSPDVRSDGRRPDCALPVTASKCGDCTACTDACPGAASRDESGIHRSTEECFFDAAACYRKAGSCQRSTSAKPSRCAENVSPSVPNTAVFKAAGQPER